MTDFFDADELNVRLLQRDRASSSPPFRCEARACLRPHAALGRRSERAMRSRSANPSRPCTTTTPNGPARSACAICCRRRPRISCRAASPSSRCGARSETRSSATRSPSPTPRSLAPKDFVAAERRFPDRVGEIYQFAYNPAHRWFYFPRMRRDEALVFKVYDSAKDGRARWGAHASFDDPTTPPHAPGARKHRSPGVRVFLKPPLRIRGVTLSRPAGEVDWRSGNRVRGNYRPIPSPSKIQALSFAKRRTLRPLP